MSTSEKPGLARTDRGVSRPLRAWLTRALDDAHALDELALAWRELPFSERRQLASLLHRDVSVPAGVDPTRAQRLFATMLALEDENALQDDLIAKIAALEPACEAFVYGDAEVGGAALLREGARGRWECLEVHWDEGVARRVACSARDPQQDLGAVLAAPAHPEQDTWRSVSSRAACERFALPLLRYTKRGGELPPGSERFANVIARG